ncbi:unnamed protein product [Cylindrotheca closterium]|uniref:Uncharacterized protein n=1 Tax=Cylindrotheca closterium TaxID=2856 RepID=A0AAD2FUE1_9STRA|nr:unnamed protein product [Cylindrotheca closterium]
MRLDKTIHQSFGHPVTDTTTPVYQVTCPEDLEPKDQWMEELEQLVDKWIEPQLTTAQRMRNGETLSPGFALLVRKGEDGQPCHNMFISNLVLTKPDILEPNTCGTLAPLGEIVINDLAHQYVTDPIKYTHFLLGSMSGHTSASPLTGDQIKFAKALLPVLLTDGNAIGNKPFNGDVWKILFFPTMSACPVGFVWPASDGFDEFQNSISNQEKVFSGLLHLLKTRKTLIESWFTAIKDSPASSAVPVVNAMLLRYSFPTKDDLDDNQVLDKALLGPFQEKMDCFIRSHLMQIIYCSKSLPTSPLGFKMHACVKMHNMHVSDSFPEALGTTLPPECQAFVNYLFPNEDEDKSWDGPDQGWQL